MIWVLALLLTGCTGFTVERFDVSHNYASDGEKNYKVGPQVSNTSFAVVELYKMNPFASSYQYHFIYKCDGAGNNCEPVSQNPTLQPGVITGLSGSVIQAGAIVGGAALIGSGLKHSGSQTTVNGNGNASANAQGGNATSGGGVTNTTVNATVNSSQTVNAPGSH